MFFYMNYKSVESYIDEFYDLCWLSNRWNNLKSMLYKQHEKNKETTLTSYYTIVDKC